MDGWEKTDRGWRKTYSRPQTPVAPGDFPCPRVMTDTMDLTEHVDGRFYDSKSAYRAVTKANGLIEVGDDPARLRQKAKPRSDPKKRRQAVEKAVAQVLT